MKTWTILLAAGFLLAALPLVTAETECSRAGMTEALDHPTKAKTYLFFDVTQPEKVGEWSEKNRSPGLQTMVCLAQSGAIKYGADQQSKVIP